MDLKFYKSKGIAEGRKHKRYRDVVQPCTLHSCECWSWNKKKVDALRGWESRNLDLMSSRKWIERGLSLEWFRTNQIRKARKMFAERGGESLEWFVLQKVWGYEGKIFDRKRIKQTDQMMRSILMQRSTSARVLDLKNQEKMKRRRAGVVHTTVS